MDISSLLPLIEDATALDRIRAQLADKDGPVTLGVADGAKAATIAALIRGSADPALIIVPKATEAADLAEELQAWSGVSLPLVLFPEREALPFEPTQPDPVILRQRLLAVQALRVAQPCVVVASAIAVAQRTISSRADTIGLDVAAGAKLSPADLISQALRLGYRTVTLVAQPGDIARRGGIVDVFSATDVQPVRVEFVGNAIESLRSFSADTQRSGERMETLKLSAAREVPSLAEFVTRLARSLDFGRTRSDVQERMEEQVDRIGQGETVAEEYFYVPFAAEGLLIDHLPATGLLVVDEPAQLSAFLTRYDEQTEEARKDLEARGEIPLGLPRPHASCEEVIHRAGRGHRLVRLSRWAYDDAKPSGPTDVIQLPYSPPDSYGGRLRAVAERMNHAIAQGGATIVVSQQAQRLAEVLAEEGVQAHISDAPQTPAAGSLAIVPGSLSRGWQLSNAQPPLTVITDHELFGFRKQRRRLVRRAGPERETFLSEISEGDVVVHIDHGVARFAGLVLRASDGVEREYLDLRFAAGDRLYVPSHQIDRISRFIGPSDRMPTLSRLGTQEWSRAKERVRRAVVDIARDLLELYAARQVLEGRAFSADTPWQQELEGSFPYVETADQIEAMRAIKVDMESERPMDRLVCGDVGYGKTELAVRAAFKAVLDGAQVAVLVPTTVLAQQHLSTFRERLAGFPVTVDMLSRFRSNAEQRSIVEKLSSGEIDIIIGTHRLLQKDIQFRTLGLVIIDEEQRFGVAHKERLKRMREEVDALTLTATPIPRSMHMALSGIRDLSMMETPPEARLPIKTYIAESDDHVIREAILRELERGGQVFFVHNRVHDIERVASRVRKLVPEAEIGIAHGQQAEHALERAMLDFVDGRTDVLICTTIIESGLDIPNVNTLIIDKADKLGLAQLYQLRGRVGRGAVRAYAYLLFDGYRALSETAQKRLQAIFEATELGAGFQIAVRDLEIRGAGNLLGAEQSGHIGAVGFDLYIRLLAEAVERLKARREHRAPRIAGTQTSATTVDLPVNAHIPSAYVADLNMRLALYNRFAATVDPAEVDILRSELRDRFGQVPNAVEQLLYVVEIRATAGMVGVMAIQMRDDEITLRFMPDVTPAQAIRAHHFTVTHVGPTQIRIRATDGWQTDLRSLLNAMSVTSPLTKAPIAPAPAC